MYENLYGYTIDELNQLPDEVLDEYIAELEYIERMMEEEEERKYWGYEG